MIRSQVDDRGSGGQLISTARGGLEQDALSLSACISPGGERTPPPPELAQFRVAQLLGSSPARCVPFPVTPHGVVDRPDLRLLTRAA
jgi:hypothetical protein